MARKEISGRGRENRRVVKDAMFEVNGRMRGIRRPAHLLARDCELLLTTTKYGVSFSSIPIRMKKLISSLSERNEHLSDRAGEYFSY